MGNALEEIVSRMRTHDLGMLKHENVAAKRKEVENRFFSQATRESSVDVLSLLFRDTYVEK
tara:strand:- start:66 stop:248 length:183 start_codon:yes stop_codon:yes gene_type:complete